jgi:thiamine monophosphate kinase
VPVADALRSVYPDDARQLALTGGEDYELILVGGEGALQLADGALRRSLDMDEPQLHIVGRITDEPGKRVRVIDATGAEVPIPRGGWDHLRA